MAPSLAPADRGRRLPRASMFAFTFNTTYATADAPSSATKNSAAATRAGRVPPAALLRQGVVHERRIAAQRKRRRGRPSACIAATAPRSRSSPARTSIAGAPPFWSTVIVTSSSGTPVNRAARRTRRQFPAGGRQRAVGARSRDERLDNAEACPLRRCSGGVKTAPMPHIHPSRSPMRMSKQCLAVASTRPRSSSAAHRCR